MKLISHFNDFLKDTVNLNVSRIEALESNVTALQTFLKDSDWKPTIRTFVEQGSWAHDTIIKPVDLGEFDADLLVMVNPVKDWSASQYVSSLGDLFKASGVYAEKTEVWDYCVTITYAGDQKVDIAPCVVGRENQGEMEVCNRVEDRFDRTEPIEYTDWIVGKNNLSGSNSFRKVTRLLKYLRDIKRRFTCSSVLLTTLIGYRIEEADKQSDAFADVPTTLQTIIGRLDDYLQANTSRPVVSNPKLESEDFAASLTTKKYRNLRKSIHRYRRWIDDAIETKGIEESVVAWQKLFGDQFGKQAVVKSAAVATVTSTYKSILMSSGAHLSTLVDKVLSLGVGSLPVIFSRPPYLEEPSWEVDLDGEFPIQVRASVHATRQSDGQWVKSGEALFPSGQIRFQALDANGTKLSNNFRVEWRVTNTGVIAFQRHQKRGVFCPPTVGTDRWEALSFRGVHFVEAFAIRIADDMLVAQSAPFYVVIT